MLESRGEIVDNRRRKFKGGKMGGVFGRGGELSLMRKAVAAETFVRPYVVKGLDDC